ncbi:MAG: DUF4178 domain-containing protein, partial [Polyangiaceae bacterium]|nr:DUF4178 domain-containing protein [Polyangiaceae bacterium]
WVTAVNLAELDLTGMPNGVGWGGRGFSRRNQNVARVDYVLGEVYWKCEIGEETQVTDFVDSGDVLSREAGGGEANWSYSAPMPWAVIANAFGLPVDGAGAQGIAAGGGTSSSGGCASTTVIIIIVVLILLICALGACGSCIGDGDGSSGGGTYRGGSGVYSGGK